tara:strand:- start:962 stop:1276 length:315 start_codon:yes stop_codon:yes gene_type:complete
MGHVAAEREADRTKAKEKEKRKEKEIQRREAHQIGCDKGLIVMILVAVAMRAIDHDFGLQLLGNQCIMCFPNKFRCIVGPGCAASAKDNVACLISFRLHNSNDP